MASAARAAATLVAAALTISALTGYLPASDAYADPLTRFVVFASSVLALWLLIPVWSLSKRYRRLALVGFTGGVSLLAANFAGALFHVGRDAVRESARERAATGLEAGPLRELAYPGMTDEEVETLREDLSRVRYDYAPFVQFSPRPLNTRFVNIRPAGFRRTSGDSGWPPADEAVNVFLFGGSTTFGSGLPDARTVPAHVERMLRDSLEGRVHVYNFARGAYYSSQELALLTELFRRGRVPDVAVFVDGLNEFAVPDDEPSKTADIRRALRSPTLQLITDSPLGDAVQYLAGVGRYGRGEGDGSGSRQLASRAREVVDRYFRNKRLIESLAEERGVRTRFVWQPVPVFGYDLDHHAFADSLADFGRESIQRPRLTRAGYRMMDSLRRSGRGRGLVWCADLQRGTERNWYVDPVHYTGEMAGRVARCVASGAALIDSLRRSG